MRTIIRLLAALCCAVLVASAAAQSNPGQGGRGFPYVGAGAGLPTWGGEVYFNTGRPYCDARSQGAIGNASATSAAADTTAINNCRTILEANGVGGVLYLSSGYYCINATITENSAPIIFRGPADGGTAVLSPCGLDITVLKLNFSYSGIENLIVYGKGANFDAGASGTPTFGATHPAVEFDSGCGGCMTNRVQVFGGSIPIYCNACVSPRIRETIAKQGYGTGGAASAQILIQNSSNPVLDTVHLDEDFPTNSFPTLPATINAWASSTAYAANQIVTMVGPDTRTYYVQATIGGTSGTGAPTVKEYGFTFADGTVTWELVGPQVHYGLQMDSGTSEMWATGLDLGGVYVAGFGMTDTISPGPGAPTFAHIAHANFLGGQSSVNANNGSDLTIVDSEFAGCMLNGCSVVAVASTWSGRIKFSNNTFFSTQPVQGVNLTAGVDFVATGNLFYGMSPALRVAAGVSDFVFNSNICGTTTALCASVLSGASNHYQIVNNDCAEASTCVSDLGSGADKTVQGSDSYLKSLGMASIGTWQAAGGSGFAFLGNSALDQTNAANFSWLQDNAGTTYLNAATGRAISLRIANNEVWQVGPSGGLKSVGGVDQGAGNLYLGNASGGNAGFLWFAGQTSGQGHFTGAANAMGTPTWLLPTNSGTMAVSGSSPLALNSTTGNLTCSTCATTTNGGALSGTAPISVSAGGAISIASSSPLSVVSSALTCPTCATTTNGGALSGTSPIAISAGGAISISASTGSLGNVVYSNSPTISGTIGGSLNWSGSQQFNSPVGILTAPTASALTLQGASGQVAFNMLGATGTGTSFGAQIAAGTNSSDWGFQVLNASLSATLFKVWGDGGIVVGAATGGDKGLSTINASTYYANGTPGVTCSGSPTASFAATNGIVTHC